MNMTRWCVRFSTLGPVGRFSASGTFATLLSLPLVYSFHALFPNQIAYLGGVVVVFVFGMMVVSKALSSLKRRDDPSEIVFDELVGCLLVFWGITLSTQSVVVGFLIFRAFDIIKFGWVKNSEDLAGAWGVMSDDVVAALLTNIILRLLF